MVKKRFVVILSVVALLAIVMTMQNSSAFGTLVKPSSVFDQSLFIRTDGTSTTTVNIPFAKGINLSKGEENASWIGGLKLFDSTILYDDSYVLELTEASHRLCVNGVAGAYLQMGVPLDMGESMLYVGPARAGSAIWYNDVFPALVIDIIDPVAGRVHFGGNLTYFKVGNSTKDMLKLNISSGEGVWQGDWNTTTIHTQNITSKIAMFDSFGDNPTPPIDGSISRNGSGWYIYSSP